MCSARYKIYRNVPSAKLARDVILLTIYLLFYNDVKINLSVAAVCTAPIYCVVIDVKL